MDYILNTLDSLVHLLLAGGAKDAQPQQRHGDAIVQQNIVISRGRSPFFVMILL